MMGLKPESLAICITAGRTIGVIKICLDNGWTMIHERTELAYGARATRDEDGLVVPESVPPALFPGNRQACTTALLTGFTAVEAHDGGGEPDRNRGGFVEGEILRDLCLETVVSFWYSSQGD